ncbi:hypothetical protein [Planktothrix pseudagardhii]|uniref:hypothetical protein n=1 Tax=Planktothrix pseudagardhii TaxID=132604 RepID=UPI003F68B7B1
MRTLSPQSFSHFPKPYHPHLPMRIVALGDSLIYGFGDPVGGGWVERLRRLWMSPNHPGHALYNLGVRGNGVAKWCRSSFPTAGKRMESPRRIPKSSA